MAETRASADALLMSVTLHHVRHDRRSPSARVSVVVADGHALFRERIERAVRERPELELVASAADGHEALGLIRELEPVVAVLDLRLPGLDGLKILHAITRDAVPTRVLILSASGDAEVVYRAVQGGAAGYFRKDADRHTILDAISAVARGGTVIDAELQAGVFDQIRIRGPGLLE
jgi:two-component system, NarL family, nitrate/nitrite response regulator NarL